MMTLVSLADAQAQSQESSDPANRILALDPRWRVSFPSPPVAPPGFDREAAYVPLQAGELLAIDLDDGRIRWTAKLSTTFTPATGDGLVFVGTESEVVALEQRSGTTLWQADLPASLSAPLYFDGGLLLAATERGELAALRAQDGQMLWLAELSSPLAVRPSSFGDHLYAALRDRRLVALDIEKGRPAWTRPIDADVTGLLAIEGQVLVGTRANVLHSVATDNGRIGWTQRAGADVFGAPAVDQDHIYFVAYDNVLRALDRRNGNLRWRRNLPSRPAGGPLRADNVVLVPLSANAIGAYLAASGEPSFTIQAAGELGGAPYLREGSSATAPRLVAVSRELGQDASLQAFAERMEPPPAPLSVLPGAPASP